MHFGSLVGALEDIDGWIVERKRRMLSDNIIILFMMDATRECYQRAIDSATASNAFPCDTIEMNSARSKYYWNLFSSPCFAALLR